MNKQRAGLLEEARKRGTPFWERVAADLDRASRKRRIVNLTRLARITKENDIVIVPGKVLGDGELPHKITLAAYTFSDTAKEKLKHCKTMTIQEFMKEHPKGAGRIIG